MREESSKSIFSMKGLFTKKNVLIACFVFLFGLLVLPPGGYFSFPFFNQKRLFNQINFVSKPQPIVKERFEEKLSAKSWLVMDVESGTLLSGENFYVSFHPASLTKIVTALVALEHFSPDQVLTVRQNYSVGRVMGLATGEKIKVIDLMSGLLIHSANDAGYVLADSYSGGTIAFIKRMNDFVKERGLTRTHFDNFSGENDLSHYSTAYDLAQLARIFLKEPLIKELIQLRKEVVAGVDGDLIHQLETTNQLLGTVSEARGLKTGWTDQAKECFIGYFVIQPLDGIEKQSGEEREIITVVMGSDDRFGETMEVLNWVKESVVWQDYSETHSIEIAGTNPKNP